MFLPLASIDLRVTLMRVISCAGIPLAFITSGVYIASEEACAGLNMSDISFFKTDRRITAQSYSKCSVTINILEYSLSIALVYIASSTGGTMVSPCLRYTGSQYIRHSYGIGEFNTEFEILKIKIHAGAYFIIEVKRFYKHQVIFFL